MFLQTDILHLFYRRPACFLTFKRDFSAADCEPISCHLSSARPSSWCPCPWTAHRLPECAAVWDDFPPSLLWPNKEQRVTLSITHCNPHCFYVWTINKYLMTRQGNKSGGAIRRRPIQPAKQSFRLTKLAPSTRSAVHVANRAQYRPETIHQRSWASDDVQRNKSLIKKNKAALVPRTAAEGQLALPLLRSQHLCGRARLTLTCASEAKA